MLQFALLTPDQKQNSGDVLGSQASCQPWKPYLPLALLIVQFVLSAVVYMFFRKPENKIKQVGAVGVIVITAIVFYLVRNCDCSQPTVWALLCKWYIVVAIFLGLITQFMNYALIEREE
jgi:amino acid transporter